MQSPNFKSTRNFASTPLKALNRADFQFRAAANFESRISSRRHRISAPRTSNQAANFLSTTSPTAPSFESRAATSRRTSNRAASIEFSPPRTSNQASIDEIRLYKG